MRPLPGAEPFPAELDTRLTAVLDGRPRERPRTRHVEPDGSPSFSNRLLLESSPYLLQHAHNPVNWYPWGDEAFTAARTQNRPVFLSIGYSTCHWCHVMEEESFENPTIAAFLNAHYVAIKVDREERPDIDAVYMRAAQRLTGSGGWPLSVWLDADRRPFFAGTYFPPFAGARGAQIGFLELLTELVRLHGEESQRVGEAAESLTAAVRAELESSPTAATAGNLPRRLDVIAAAVEQCRRGFDEGYGGLRLPHKFPSHVPVRLLLRHHQRTGDSSALHMATQTLDNMARGGIYDHIGGGFHRYATDREWLVPHFEKMLYDNALLVVAYTEAWQVTRRADFARVVRETCDAMLSTFASPEGGFYSATDADSEGEEGKYFVWKEDEIRALLGPDGDTDLFIAHYGITQAGNFELGNILHLREVNEDVVERLAPARARLAHAREMRTPPLRDEKILAAWNGLALSALAIAGRVFGQERYLMAAKQAATFLLDRMTADEGRLLFRSYRAGHLGVAGFLDDYAFVAAGLLDLFEAVHEPRWFLAAQRLCEETQKRFADESTGGWFMAGANNERLLARERPIFDGAEPSGSSVALMNAARLATLTDAERWRSVAERALGFYLPLAAEQAMTMCEALLAVDYLEGPVREIVVALPADDAPSAGALDEVLRETFSPRKVLLRGVPASRGWLDLEPHVPLLRGRASREGLATAFVCSQGKCDLPTTQAEDLRAQLA
jgi:uncharacterized protein YyaL (SSP411 family)